MDSEAGEITQLTNLHFHRLVDELGERGEVTLGHMSCLNNDEEDEQDITFLYKLSPGRFIF